MKISREIRDKYEQSKEWMLKIKEPDAWIHLLSIIEDLLLLDPVFSAKSQLDETLWKFCFHSKLETMQQNKKGFLEHLEVATAFYKTLIFELQAEYNLDFDAVQFTGTPQQLEARGIVYRSYVYMGDAERYKTSHLRSMDYSTSRICYQKAFGIWSSGGARPHCQIATLAKMERKPFEQLYYNCLALGNINAGPWIRDTELHSQLSHVLYLLWHPTEQHLKDIQSACSQIVDNMIPKDLNKHALEFMVGLIVVIKDLNTQFSSVAQAQVKQWVRCLQTVAMFIAMDLCMYCLKQDLNYTASLYCLWFQHQPNMLIAYLKYGHIMGSDQFLSKLYEWSASVCEKVNSISYFVDFDLIYEFLPQDKDLCGLEPLHGYYSQCKQDSKDVNLVYNRMAYCVREMANDDNIHFVTSKEGVFEALDPNAKQRKMQLAMSKMAAQRLKAEISRLEEETGSEKPPEILLLLDASCFVNHLQEIKQLLMAKKCCFLVCQQVMQELDQLKKGTFAINREAREANRYLEQRFKYPSVYLKGQLPHEQSDPHESNVFIPTIHRSILMCASYFMTLDQEFCLVTENAELKSLAQSLSIPVQEFQYWKSRL